MAVAKQAKGRGRKLKLQEKEDEEGDSEEDDKAADKLWGASKKAYYADGEEYEVRVLHPLHRRVLQGAAQQRRATGLHGRCEAGGGGGGSRCRAVGRAFHGGGDGKLLQQPRAAERGH